MANAEPAPSGTLDFVRCLRLVTEDPDWIKKVLIGGGFVLLSGMLVGLPFVLGYYGRVVRNAAAGQSRPLPDWDDLGGLFGEGLQLLAVYLGHVLGVFVLVAALGCVVMLPAMLVGGLGRRDAADAIAALSGLGILAVYGLMMVLSLALGVYLPAALARAALRGTISGRLRLAAQPRLRPRQPRQLPAGARRLPGGELRSRSSASCSAAWASFRPRSGATSAAPRPSARRYVSTRTRCRQAAEALTGLVT